MCCDKVLFWWSVEFHLGGQSSSHQQILGILSCFDSSGVGRAAGSGCPSIPGTYLAGSGVFCRHVNARGGLGDRAKLTTAAGCTRPEGLQRVVRPWMHSAGILGGECTITPHAGLCSAPLATRPELVRWMRLLLTDKRRLRLHETKA